ncbi:MAG: DUF1573 domain-containing protein [Bacteroidia bacterium]
MKRFAHLPLLMLMLLAAPLAMAQSQSNASGKAEITFENDAIDYGSIEQNANGEREFQFKNTGSQPLIITGCNGSCGCTVPECPKEPIKPGESGVIKVKYDTNRLGRFSKTITVNSNASEPARLLRISGEVLEPGSKENVN